MEVVHSNERHGLFGVEDVIGDVVKLHGQDLEVMNRCFVAFLDQHGFLIHEMPCGVTLGVVIQRELLLYAVFGVDKGRLIDIGFGILGNLHEGRDVISDFIRTEVHDGQMVVRIFHQSEACEESDEGNAQFGLPNKSLWDRFAADKQNNHERQQDDILPEGLPIGKNQRVSEAATVRDRIRECYPEGERGHDEIEEQ